MVFLLPDARAFALKITPECTSAFLIAPFAIVGATMLLRRRLDPMRVLLGVSIAAVLLVLANQLRVGMIAGLIDGFGLQEGYKWGHLVLGSLLSIVFLAGSLALLLWVVASGYPRSVWRRPHEQRPARRCRARTGDLARHQRHFHHVRHDDRGALPPS